MFTLKDVFFAFTVLAILLLVGRWLKHKIYFFQQIYLPSSIIAGGVALLLGPQVLGVIAGVLGYPADSFVVNNGVFPEAMRTVWAQSPGVFINIVFAALFLGEIIPSPRDIWRKAAPQVAFGQTLAWGQYVVGLLLTLLILTPIFGMNPISGALIEIAFEGGHGTAAGMADTLVELGFPEGADMALGLATVGIVTGIISGTILANWGRRKGYVRFGEQTPSDEGENADIGPVHPVEDPDIVRARARLTRNLLIDPLSLNFGFVALAVGIGWLILDAMKRFEAVTWGATGFEIIRYVPLFPMALIGGIIVQLVMKRMHVSPLIMRPLQNNIAGLALDVVIITALASISLQALGENLMPFLLISLVGIVWNIWAFVFLAPRLLPSYWFERGIGDMGQSMGVTATGILLIRMVDPQNQTGAFESFAYKQLFFEPIVGGGLFTAAAPVLIQEFGPVGVLLLTGGLLIFWLVFGFTLFRRMTKHSVSEPRPTVIR